MVLLRMLFRLLSRFLKWNKPDHEFVMQDIQEPAQEGGFSSSYAIDPEWTDGILRGKSNMEQLRLMPNLSACFVIKNETDVIEKSLSSLVGLADEIVIVDTGSTDDTLEKIAAWAAAHGYAGRVTLFRVGRKFHDEDGDFDFGQAKEYACTQAAGDYVLWMDGADMVLDPKSLREEFEYNVRRNQYFQITCNTKSAGQSFPRERIFPYKCMKWAGAVHEHLVPTRDLVKIRSDVAVEHQFKERNGSNLERNLRILLKEWNRSPGDSRTCMYIANSYFDLGTYKPENYDLCIPWYERRIYDYSYTEWPEETFKAMENLAKIYLFRKDAQTLDKWACELVSTDPQRREGYYYRMCVAVLKGDKASAMTFMQKCLSYGRRGDFLYWVDPTIYDDEQVRKILA